jgi:hypothetical protein
MKVNLIAGIFFTGILASSAAQAASTDEAKSASDRAKAYLSAVEVIQKQYAGYGLDVTREALIRVSAYHYPDFAAQQDRVAHNVADKVSLAAGK